MKFPKINKTTKDYWQCPICGVIFIIEHKFEHIELEKKDLKKALKYLIDK